MSKVICLFHVVQIYGDATISPETLNSADDPDNIPLITPLKTDFTSTPVFYRVTQDDHTLHEVVDKIAMRNSNLRDYHPHLAIIFTVHDAVFSNYTKNVRVSHF